MSVPEVVGQLDSILLCISDAQTVIAFLKTYGLEDDFKVSVCKNRYVYLLP